MIKNIAALTALLLASSAAFAAQPNTFYAGGDIGRTRADTWNDHKTSFGGFVGYTLHPNVALEAGLRRLGKEEQYGYKITGEQASLSLLGTLPLGESFSVYGRLGVNRLEAKYSYRGDSVSDSTTKALYGVGLSYAITPALSARVEVQKPGSDVTNLSTGLSFQF